MAGIRITREDLDNRFGYHRPGPQQVAQHEQIRTTARELAELLTDICPPSRELSLAIGACEEAMMWANAAIAREPTKPKG